MESMQDGDGCKANLGDTQAHYLTMDMKRELDLRMTDDIPQAPPPPPSLQGDFATLTESIPLPF